ncbi:hypothetical protein ZOSMA_469G00050 [Zostera marina]|uniref:Gnk2-homologous domain-containing protein n=1 Tax=Zostera marina TaxID=29655 RepID=A0A0K9P2G4_ZOSMR|nr:hypothetical protein ZOSMA_469G00050 [Zostera marina]
MILQKSKNRLHSFVCLIILILSLSISSALYSTYEIEDCNYGTGNYTNGSIYEDNLKLLLSSLSKSTPITGYFEDTISSNGTNEVFGHAMCRGDLELPDECIPCLQYASIKLTTLCPYRKNAGVLYDKCFLRYGSENFFGTPTGSWWYSNLIKNISTDAEKFIVVRKNLFSKLVMEATSGTISPDFFAAGQEVVSSHLNVFALLHCTRDLSLAVCKECLEYHANNIFRYSAYHAGSMHLGIGCFLRYENQIFFNSPTLPPPPAIPPPSPPAKL